MAPRKKQPERHPRRKPGTGSIRFKKGRDLPYEAAYPLGHGRHRYDYFATWEEAAAHLDSLVKDAMNEEHPRNIAGGSQRLDTYLVAHLNRVRPHVAPKTFLSYKYYCDLAVGYFGGARRIDEILRDHADAMLLYFFEEGFQNVSQMRACLMQAFKYATDEGYVKKNPFEKAKAPPVERRKGIALTRAQRARLLECAAIEDRLRRDKELIPLCPLWHLYSRLGFRKGEGIGLRWGDINWEEKTITIVQQYTNVGSKTERRSTTKTKKSRTFPVPDDILSLLRVLQIDQVKRAAADPDWVTHGLVFTDPHGYPLSVWYVQHRWEVLRKRAGIPEQIRIHDLRHTADYLMEKSGIPRSSRMSIVGHTTVAMDRLYTDHADMEAMREAIEKMGS